MPIFCSNKVFILSIDGNVYFYFAPLQDYNDVSDDMREDEETKAEIHQRIDDLREVLWNICDERKDQAEKERETIMNDGWLDDRLGVLSNFYMTIMQSEVDRFQDTVRMLKDYYRAQDGQLPEELASNYVRLPLIEVRSQTEFSKNIKYGG